MTELERVAYAKTFIDKLANGINPIDDQPVAENDAINNVRLSRCFFYVSDILRQVIENGGINPAKKKAREPFAITQEQLSRYPFSEDPIPISEITRRINDLVDTAEMKLLSYNKITGWLMSIQALAEHTKADGKTTKHPTEAGNQLGIYLEKRESFRGEFFVVVYNKEAQAFIIDNMNAILAFENK